MGFRVLNFLKDHIGEYYRVRMGGGGTRSLGYDSLSA